MVQFQKTHHHRSPRPRAATSADPFPKVRRGARIRIPRRSYREALILLEFMPYRSTDRSTKAAAPAVANAENNLSGSL